MKIQTNREKIPTYRGNNHGNRDKSLKFCYSMKIVENHANDENHENRG